MKAYSIFDKKAGTYSNPMFLVSDGVARRSLLDALDDPKTLIHAHPEDFELYCVGEFDEVTGSLLPITENGAVVPPRFLSSALDFVNKNESTNS